MNKMKEHAMAILDYAIEKSIPQAAVQKALSNWKEKPSRIILISIGKAAWTMADAAIQLLGDTVKKGVVITKYGHSQGPIAHCIIHEAAHPVPDENTVQGGKLALEAIKNLSKEDTVLFLVSGGGSALFEVPEDGISLHDIQEITTTLLSCGADIIEINTIRKRLSAVKGGKFAMHCAPANVFTIALSDVLGDRPDSIASGPTCPDETTCADALKILDKYHIHPKNPRIMRCLQMETPKFLSNVKTEITGSVNLLCAAAAQKAQMLGYHPIILTTNLTCEAKEAGKFLASIAKTISQKQSTLPMPCAIICGGETVVHVTGNGKGGRNQEVALAAAEDLAGLENTVLAAIGSDGTDGPTDAAGGICDGTTKERLMRAGFSIPQVLEHNDAYTALSAIDSLIFTGPTGTNVNDLYFLLCK